MCAAPSVFALRARAWRTPTTTERINCCASVSDRESEFAGSGVPLMGDPSGDAARFVPRPPSVGSQHRDVYYPSLAPGGLRARHSRPTPKTSACHLGRFELVGLILSKGALASRAHEPRGLPLVRAVG